MSPSLSLNRYRDFLIRAMLATTIGLDIETNGRDVRDGTGFGVGVSLAIREGDTYSGLYFPLRHAEPERNIEEDIKHLLFDVITSRKNLCMHNAKTDIESWKTVGLDLTDTNWYCTMMMAHFLNENVPKGLDWLARHELNEQKVDNAAFKAFWKMGLGDHIPVAEFNKYAIHDAILCLMLFEKLYPFFVKWGFDGPAEMPGV